MSVSAPSGWTCSFDDYSAWCAFEQSLSPAAPATFDFMVQGTYPATYPQHGVSVSSALTVDPNLMNDTRYVDAAIP